MTEYFRNIIVCSLAAILLTGCGENYRELDEKQLRRQFHIPSEVRLDSLVSNPETGGWFGREGLRIRGVFQFNEMEFEKYLNDLQNGETWTPVRFLNYTPDGAETWSAGALRWSGLPLPELPAQLSHLGGLFDTSIRRGSYFCFLIVTEPGEQEKQDDGDARIAWKTIGIHGSELRENQFPTITTYGILDHDRRRLYAWIGFRG